MNPIAVVWQPEYANAFVFSCFKMETSYITGVILSADGMAEVKRQCSMVISSRKINKIQTIIKPQKKRRGGLCKKCHN